MDEQLKLVMSTLEHVSDDQKLSVAADLIQMVIEARVPDTDDFIEDINLEYVPIRRRWYDKFESLHSAIEMLKFVSGDEKSHVLKELIESIIYFQNNASSNNKEDKI
jgi:aminopeptidase-like protein